jgi:hypothetical protein
LLRNEALQLSKSTLQMFDRTVDRHPIEIAAA